MNRAATHRYHRPPTAEYERLITAVHDATLRAGKKLCGPYAWRLNPDANGVPRPDFSCFQN